MKAIRFEMTVRELKDALEFAEDYGRTESKRVGLLFTSAGQEWHKQVIELNPRDELPMIMNITEYKKIELPKENK